MSGTEPWSGGQRPILMGSATAEAGLLSWCLGLALEPRQALFSLLAAFTWLMSIQVSALILLMTIHAARSSWPIALRRLLEGVTATLPLLAVLFLPIGLLASKLYVWAGAAPLEPSVQAAVLHKGAWLSQPFFLIRSVGYLAAWILLGERLRGWSLQQDLDGDPQWQRRQYSLSGGGLLLAAFTLTFASFDWLMSLTPDWKSSIYGVYVFAGGIVSAFAVLILLLRIGAQAGLLRDVVNKNHFLSAGKYLFTFTIFWAYTAFSQFFIIWIADMPSEVTWWVQRMQGWAAASIVLLFAHFVVPFAVLLSRDFKQQPGPLAALSVWTLAAHYLDAVWLTGPALHPDRPHASWLDLSAMLLVGGAAVAFGIWRARGHALVPFHDQRLIESVAYEGS